MSTQSWYRSQSTNGSPEEERPLGELFSDMTRSLQVLVRKEVELAKVEVKDQASRASKAVAALAVAGVIGFVALLLLAFAAAWGSAEAIPPGLAFLAVGLLFTVVAALLAVAGKKKLAAVKPPRQTVETLREDVEVAKTSLSRGAHS